MVLFYQNKSDQKLLDCTITHDMTEEEDNLAAVMGLDSVARFGASAAHSPPLASPTASCFVAVALKKIAEQTLNSATTVPLICAE